MRFIHLLQERHTASTNTNAVLHQQAKTLVTKLNAARTSAITSLSGASAMIHNLQWQLLQIRHQRGTTTSNSTLTNDSKDNWEDQLDLVPASKFMAVVKERNLVQQQLSATLSEFENIHAKDVVSGAEALEKSLRLTRIRQAKMQQVEIRACGAEQKLAASLADMHTMSLELSSCKQTTKTQAMLLQQNRRERTQLQRRVKDNEAEIILLKEALTFAESKNDDAMFVSQAIDAHWKGVVANIEARSKRRAGTFDRADRFLAETKINLLERELEIKHMQQSKMEKGLE